MPENWFLRLSLHNYSGFWNDYKTPARSSKTSFWTPVFDFWREKQVGFLKNNKISKKIPQLKMDTRFFDTFCSKRTQNETQKNTLKIVVWSKIYPFFLTAECTKLVVKQLFKPKTCEPYPSQLLWPANYFNYKRPKIIKKASFVYSRHPGFPKKRVEYCQKCW